MEELKETIKTKNGKTPEEGSLNSGLYKHREGSFHKRLLVFLVTFIDLEEMTEE
jgi:hypothetical protein